ncbi:MAG: DNA internalization-related competence protein ComEC/Rec2 [Lachnospiraceae bacterium]|nr:DNA internalization-related competence protein ComEC/Rec2 [Lachnospiraceae bacterium]
MANRAIHCFCDGEQVTLDGILYKKEFKNNSYRLYIKNIYISNSSFPGRGILIHESDDIPLGSKLHISMKIKTFSKAKNEGSFDEESYYLSQGIYLRGEIQEVIRITPRWPSFFQEGLYELREEMKCVYGSFLPGEEAGLLTAMTLGDKTALEEEVKQLFSDAGLSHILAVSGLHISIVGMGLFRLLRKRGIGFSVSGFISGIFVICYGCMTGLSVSTLRAVIMFLILMMAQIFGRVYDMISAWCVAVIFVLLAEPMSVYNVGFIFSFGAVLGIAIIANPMVDIYEKACRTRYERTLRFRKGIGYKKDFKERILSSILFALGIQLFSLPLVAYFYFQVPVYVMGLNLLLIPLLSMVIGMGLVGGIVGSIFPWAKIMLFPCHLVLYLYELASDMSLNLPVAQIISGRPSILRIILYYVLLFSFVWGWKWWKKDEKKKSLSPKIYCYSSLGLLLCCALLLTLHPVKSFEVDMLWVGQGDGIFITSEEGVNFFVDGGSTSEKELGKYVLKPFLLYHGVRKIDYWFLSHMDSDHISGCMELLEEGFSIGNVVVTDTLQNEKGDSFVHYETLVELCKANGTKLIHIKKGDVVATESLQFLCLGPDSPATFTGANENSMILKLSYGKFDVLFTGDIGSDQEEWLLEEWDETLFEGDSGEIEVLKLAHHGAHSSNSMEWLKEISPRISIVSAGENNPYGHPHKETIHRMEALNLPFLCTKEYGQIKIRGKKDGTFLVNCYVKDKSFK